MIVGYTVNRKGYKLWDAELKNCTISRDIRFDESITDSQSKGENVTSVPLKSAFIIEIESVSYEDDEETAQIKEADVTADEDEDKNENSDQIESHIQPQNNVYQSDTNQNEPPRNTIISKKV